MVRHIGDTDTGDGDGDDFDVGGGVVSEDEVRAWEKLVGTRRVRARVNFVRFWVLLGI